MQEEVAVYDRENLWRFKEWENKGRVKNPLWGWIVGLLILAIPFFNIFCSLVFLVFYIIQACDANAKVENGYACSRYRIALFDYIGKFFNKKY